MMVIGRNCIQSCGFLCVQAYALFYRINSQCSYQHVQYTIIVRGFHARCSNRKKPFSTCKNGHFPSPVLSLMASIHSFPPPATFFPLSMSKPRNADPRRVFKFKRREPTADIYYPCHSQFEYGRRRSMELGGVYFRNRLGWVGLDRIRLDRDGMTQAFES